MGGRVSSTAHAERVAAHRRWWRSGTAVLLRTTVSLIGALTLLNIAGAAATALVALYVVPEPDALTASGSVTTYIIVAASYGAAAVIAGTAMGIRSLSSLRDWLPSERPPTPEQQLIVLRGPRMLARGVGLLWFLGMLLFGALTIRHSVDGSLRMMAIVGLSGVITSSVAFRLAELLLREAAARALSASEHPQKIAQSVAVRSIMTWVAGTGAPVLGVVLLGVASLVDHVGTRRDLAIATAVLGANCLLAGFITTVFVTRATADPIVSVRRALARIERGELDVSVPVYDGTDIGLLQAGFNRMAAGLREREQLRDLFGRHVGVDVARLALEHGIELGGELRDVAVLYIDIVGSTRIAAQMPAHDVVDLLNRFFGIVIEVVESADGFINKFAGDAALAIFGAPAPLADREARALRAAKELAQRVAAEIPEIDFGVGVASGEAVAGNIGGTSRYEYTVIGDPVNEAARLGELAKRLPGRVAASASVVGAAPTDGWEVADAITLRGRADPTTFYVPA
ncbi:MAG TPA: adenylate/guanylate cyclase domain-containing protein [Mycobacteriales bacterium]|nr:adenylate/guanylate cyclase domain-containing protein [Mycobacteriales bacterium]